LVRFFSRQSHSLCAFVFFCFVFLDAFFDPPWFSGDLSLSSFLFFVVSVLFFLIVTFFSWGHSPFHFPRRSPSRFGGLTAQIKASLFFFFCASNRGTVRLALHGLFSDPPVYPPRPSPLYARASFSESFHDLVPHGLFLLDVFRDSRFFPLFPFPTSQSPLRPVLSPGLGFSHFTILFFFSSRLDESLGFGPSVSLILRIFCEPLVEFSLNLFFFFFQLFGLVE